MDMISATNTHDLNDSESLQSLPLSSGRDTCSHAYTVEEQDKLPAELEKECLMTEGILYARLDTGNPHPLYCGGGFVYAESSIRSKGRDSFRKAVTALWCVFIRVQRQHLCLALWSYEL